jgi:hypothetical protein
VVLESSNDQDHAHGNYEQRRNNASGNFVGSASNIPPLNGPRTSHGVAPVASHSQIASQGTGVDNFHDGDMAMYRLSTSAPTTLPAVSETSSA